ncbi:MAG: hypothetical protein EP346_06930 [Bacteroidetes bacterium]|nr:MAG: hypothetical protein EP346_06930 [Bacteroidota bacterium]
MPMDDKAVQRTLNGLKATLKRTPRLVGQESVRFFRRSFDRQGFVDSGLKRWPARLKSEDAGRSILVKSGRLRDSIRVISATSRRVQVGTDVPYAAAHNEGGVQYVKPHTRVSKNGNRYQVKGYSYKLRQRRFIGQSKALDRHLTTTIKRELLKNFK